MAETRNSKQPHRGTVIRSNLKRPVWHWAAALAVTCLVLAATAGLVVPHVRQAVATRQILNQLASPDEQARKEGAWRSATRPPGPATDMIAALLSEGREPVPGVRESYVYALGRLRLKACLPLLLRVAREDPSGYVRQAAWIAASRVDFGRFREAAQQAENTVEAWDKIGIAAALMENDDLSQLPFLFNIAANGDDFQRNIAGTALSRYLRPLLRAAGRWPLTSEISAGGAWSRAFVEEVRRRAATLNLAQIAAYSRPEQQGTESLRRMIRRIYGARARVVRVLYSIEAD